MKVSNVKIQLDKKVFSSGSKLTGSIIIKSPSASWQTNTCIFLKLYDELGIMHFSLKKYLLRLLVVFFFSFAKTLNGPKMIQHPTA
jgi:hypothetical protein